MTPIDISSALAAEHTKDLYAAAARNRLAVLARCCKPAAWRHIVRRTRGAGAGVVSWFRRGQLGPVRTYCSTC
jgi:hypothetical protein